MSNDSLNTRGCLFVFSSPSGGGKTTIIKRIFEIYPQLKFSVSATTRPCRADEIDGKAYWFLKRADFERMINENRFVEYEEVHGEYYGTLREPVEEALAAGECMIFDLDVKGGLHLKRLYPEAALIFIMAPSLQVLKQRLINRGETEEAAAQRLKRAEMEIEEALDYDYLVVNDDLERAVKEVAVIIEKTACISGLYNQRHK